MRTIVGWWPESVVKKTAVVLIGFYLSLGTRLIAVNDMATQGERLLTIRVEEEEIRNVIREVADAYEINVIIPDELVGSVSLRLKDVTWQQVFDVVLEPAGFSYVRDENIIWIKGRETLLSEPSETRVFVLNYARAREIEKIVATLLDGAGGEWLQVYERLNALVVHASPSKLKEVELLL